MSKRPATKGGMPSNVPIPVIRFDDDDDGLPGASYGRRGSKFGKLLKRRRRTSSKPRGFFGWLFSLALRLATYYTLFSAFFTCGTGFFRFNYSSNDPRAVCRTLAHAKLQLLPIVAPLVKDMQVRLDPYVGPYFRHAAPIAQKVYEVGKPQYDRIEKHSMIVYKKHVEPAQKRAVKRGRAYADPHIKKARQHFHRQVQPHIDTLHKTIKPYRDIYHRDVAPYVSHAQEKGLNAAVASHSFYLSQVQPRLIVAFKQLLSFWQHHLSPALRRAFRLTVQPLVNKATLRLFGWEWRPIDSDFVYETPQEQPASSAKKIESLTEAIKEKIVPTRVTEVMQEASSTIASVVGEETAGSSIDSLDQELEEELDHLTQQLESWERGMSKLIADEVRHYESLIRKGVEGDDLATERQASIGSVRRYLRQARSAYNKLMDDAKFDRSVDDFEGWDKGLGVRVKLFAEDLEKLEAEVIESIKVAAATATEAFLSKAEEATEAAADVVEETKERAGEIQEPVESPVDFSLVEELSEAAATATEYLKEAVTEAAAAGPLAGNEEEVEDDDAPHDAPAVINAEGSVADDGPQSVGSTPTREDHGAVEPQAAILPVGADEPNIYSTDKPTEQPPQPAEADVREPTFSILPTEDAQASAESTSSSLEEVGEPTYSILPVEVSHEHETKPVKAATSSEDTDGPIFSILPIEVIDDEGTPAQKSGRPGRHEEL